ncbi:MAG: hypothetical protein ACRDV3_15600 [Acidothermaceae bacterium]
MKTATGSGVVVAPASNTGAQFAAAYLRQLLSQPGPYRRSWQRYAFRWRSSVGAVNQASVAQVLARHIWEAGDGDDRHTLPRGLKDRVARALHGEVLSPRTLRLFIDAFGFNESEVNRLWLLLGAPVYEAPYVLATHPEPGLRTLLLHDFCFVGADALVKEQRTIQVIRAVERGMDRLVLPVDADARLVEVVRGGRAGPIVIGDAGGLTAAIEFGRELRPGDTASVEYRVLFGGSAARPQTFRRSALRRVDNVEMRVQFDPRRLPSSVSWKTWSGIDGPVKSERVLQLDDDCSAHHYLPRLESATVGFCWCW